MTVAPAIQWAAFYSDCEHEVYEVKSGHRITLTYNLYATRGQGHLAGSSPVLDPTQLPFHDTLQQALVSPGFLRRGNSSVREHTTVSESRTDEQHRSRSSHLAES